MKRIHSIKLPDGTTETRESARTYTHVVVGVTTEEEKLANCAILAKRVADTQDKIARLSDENQINSARHELQRLLVAMMAAEGAGQEDLVVGSVRGKAKVYGWSQSAKGAEAEARRIRKLRPHAKVIVMTDIKVVEKGKRTPESAEALQSAIEDGRAEPPSHPLAGLVPPILEPAQAEAKGQDSLPADLQPLVEVPVKTVSCPVCRIEVEKTDAKIEEVFGWRRAGGRKFRQSYCRKCRGKGV